MISLRTHNVLDYVIGVVLCLCPFLFDFASVDAARNLFLIGGVALICYSLFTNYYYAIAHSIPLGVHMTIDALLGVVLILGPALFNYRELLTDGQYAVHIIVGIGAASLVAVTRTRTEASKTPSEKAGIAHEAPFAP